MSDYPEHEKMQAVKPETEAAGEFADWLRGQGIQFMRWSENLKDWHPVSDRCPQRDGRIPRGACTPRRFDEHCSHWQEDKGECCLCGRGQMTEVTLTGWVADARTLERLLAEWAGVDLAAIEREKRAMLASLRVEVERS